jgi:hypothetical protein
MRFTASSCLIEINQYKVREFYVLSHLSTVTYRQRCQTVGSYDQSLSLYYVQDFRISQ